MPDGKPGDNPLTDIAIHGEEIFDHATNECIRRLVNGAPVPFLEILGDLVWYWPRVGGASWSDVADPENFRRAIEGIERSWKRSARKGE